MCKMFGILFPAPPLLLQSASPEPPAPNLHQLQFAGKSSLVHRRTGPYWPQRRQNVLVHSDHNTGVLVQSYKATGYWSTMTTSFFPLSLMWFCSRLSSSGLDQVLNQWTSPANTSIQPGCPWTFQLLYPISWCCSCRERFKCKIKFDQFWLHV